MPEKKEKKIVLRHGKKPECNQEKMICLHTVGWGDKNQHARLDSRAGQVELHFRGKEKFAGVGANDLELVFVTHQ